MERPNRLARTSFKRELPRINRTPFTVRPRPLVTRLPARSLPKAPTIARTVRTIPRPIHTPVVLELPAQPLATHEDAYLDYSRTLTAEGGVLLVYKDLDLRLRHTIWRLGAWSASTGAAWAIIAHSQIHSRWIAGLALLSAAVINWLIVRKPVEVLRSIEIRPDCMILEGCDVFWLRKMEGGWPEFAPDEDGNEVLAGIYGTRWIEFLTVRRFYDNDRMIEVLEAHLKEAMTRLWEPAIALGTVQMGSGR
ncbi:MAG TPA: hypothetical protein VKW08_18190 [Xanthobacteraceae bacterium]|nr:hypothetical protein [Xanthobacteraceae bacterium]